MSTWTQVSPGSSVPEPANDLASITVPDRPLTAPTGCTPLLGSRSSVRITCQRPWPKHMFYVRRNIAGTVPIRKALLPNIHCYPMYAMSHAAYHMHETSLLQTRHHAKPTSLREHTSEGCLAPTARIQFSFKSPHRKSTAPMKMTSANPQ